MSLFTCALLELMEELPGVLQTGALALNHACWTITLFCGTQIGLELGIAQADCLDSSWLTGVHILLGLHMAKGERQRGEGRRKLIDISTSTTLIPS